jgi:hypothetical protein
MTHLLRDRDTWLAFVDTVTKLRMPIKCGYFLTDGV